MTKPDFQSERVRFDDFVVNEQVLASFSFSKATCDVSPIIFIQHPIEVPAIEPRPVSRPTMQAPAPLEKTQPPVEDPFFQVLNRYLEQLDEHFIFPLLAAESGAAASEILRAQREFFRETTRTMRKLLADAPLPLPSSEATKASARDLVRIGARLAGDTGAEIDFILSTFDGACSIARSLGKVHETEVSNYQRYRQCQELFGIGQLLLSAAADAPGRTAAGLSFAMQIARYGAVHGYATVRTAWEDRQGDIPDPELAEVSDSEYRLAMAF